MWDVQIEREIQRCDLTLVLISPDVNRHEQGQQVSFVRREIHTAQSLGKDIIVVLAQPTTVPTVIAGEQYIDCTTDDAFTAGVATLRFKLMLPHPTQVLQEWHLDVMNHSVFGVPVACENAENHPNPR